MPASRTLIVEGYFKQLAHIADFVEAVAAEAGLDERASYAVQMAVDEACTNIIEHAYGGEGQGEIEIACQIKSNGLQVVITDQGQPFDPAQVAPFDPQTPLSERNRRGMGMFFIHHLMDRADYIFDTPAGNQLILFKGKETDVSHQSES